jgi:hypothetical protein
MYKIGQILVGTEEATIHYKLTREGAVVEVVSEVDEYGDMRVRLIGGIESGPYMDETFKVMAHCFVPLELDNRRINYV